MINYVYINNFNWYIHISYIISTCEKHCNFIIIYKTLWTQNFTLFLVFPKTYTLKISRKTLKLNITVTGTYKLLKNFPKILCFKCS